MAEWIRRLTRNQFASGSAGSNPADCEIVDAFFGLLVEVVKDSVVELTLQYSVIDTSE